MTPVILLGPNENGLSVARSLGPRGVPVFALGGEDWLRRSRYVEGIPYDRPKSRSADALLEVWLRWLRGPESDRFAGSVLVPCNDVSVELIARNRAELSGRFLLDESRDELTLALLDKTETYRIAAEADVEAPRIWHVANRAELERVLPELRYPCAIKPRNSSEFWWRLKTKLLVAADQDELLRHFAVVDELGIAALVTEVIPGADDDYYSYWTYVDSTDRLRFHFTKRKFRQYPIHHGLGTLHASYLDEEVHRLGERFVRGSGLRGIAVVEFKRDARDGRLKLMECNVRVTKSNEVIVQAGIDLPRLVYERITGGDFSPPEGFIPGVALWFPFEDISALRRYRRSGELTFRQWLKPLLGRTRLPVFSLRDPGPSLAILADRIAWQLRRRRRR